MFGKNVIRKLDREEDGKIAVQEIFYTLQGEGPHMLKPAVFIRLAGCHLACTFCDTEFETGISNRLSTLEIMTKVYALIADLPFMPVFVITGGEPMRQDITTLLYALLQVGTATPTVQIETAGSIWHPLIPVSFFDAGMVELVCSPKTPYLHPNVQKYCAHYKYIIQERHIDSHDGLPTVGTQVGTIGRTNQIARPPAACSWPWRAGNKQPVTIWVSPCDEKDAELNRDNTRACVQSAMKFGYRVSLQSHKLLNLP